MSEIIAGKYLSGETSLAIDANIRLDGGDLVVTDEAGGELSRAKIREAEISSRLGNVPRRIQFPDQSNFETEANDIVDEWLRTVGKSKGIVPTLEGKLRYVLPFTAVTILVTWAFVAFGLPALAGIAARNLPQDILDGAAESTLAFLDKVALEPTGLAPERRREIETLIQRTFPPKEALVYEVVFRRGDTLGANAFALPDGTIVFTDELVELLPSDEEILAVFAHELGHVAERHSLRQLLQDTSIAVLSYLVIGEATDTLQEALNALPAILMHDAYSREFESEADDYAIRLLREAGISPQRLADALNRLSHEHGGEEGLKYLSSHPPSKERIRKAEEASQ